MAKSNVFGITRETEIVSGIPLLKRNSLTPAESIWLDENTKQAREDYNKSIVDFTKKVRESLKLETEEEAYHLLQNYYLNDRDSNPKAYDAIELLSLKDTSKTEKDLNTKQLTYLIQSRLIPEKFPKDEFLEVFGLAYEGEWTQEHTIAITELHTSLNDFFRREMNGGKKAN